MSLISCTLTIAGQDIADQPEDVPTTTAALDGLTLAWGRESLTDQPSASVLSAQVSIPPDQSAAVLDTLTVGTPVTVTSTTPLWQQGDISLINTFETAYVAHAGTITPDGDSLVVQATTGGYYRGPLIGIAPGPLQDQLTNLGAWDDIRPISAGSQWTVSITVDGLTVNDRCALWALYFEHPWAASAELGELLDAHLAYPTKTLTATFTPPASRAGQWLGIGVNFAALGRLWGADSMTLWSDVTETWAQTGQATLTAPAIIPPQESATLTSRVFDGSITDLTAQWDPRLGTVLVSLRAADMSATLANIRLSDEPWPAEPAGARVSRLNAALPITNTFLIDEPLAAITVQTRDVDSAAASDVLDELAVSTGGVLWSTTHETSGAYLYLEDHASRPALEALTLDDTGAPTITPLPDRATVIEASRITRDSISLLRDTTGVASSVSVRWQEAGTDDQGNATLTDRTETVTDTNAIDAIGWRSMSVSTSLTSSTAAQRLALSLLTIASPQGWTLNGLTWDTTVSADDTAPDVEALTGLLDATRRIGAPIMLTDLPEWMPEAPYMPAYLEGGTYTYQDGAWTLDLTLTRPTKAGDAITWGQAPPTLTWEATTLTWAVIGTLTTN